MLIITSICECNILICLTEYLYIQFYGKKYSSNLIFTYYGYQNLKNEQFQF